MVDTEDFLSHYGVKGMKWGVRRSAKELARSSPKAKAKAMSDDELKNAINRLRLEKDYVTLSKQLQPGREGKEFAKNLLKESGKQAIGPLVATGIATAVAVLFRQRVKPK